MNRYWRRFDLPDTLMAVPVAFLINTVFIVEDDSPIKDGEDPIQTCMDAEANTPAFLRRCTRAKEAMRAQ